MCGRYAASANPEDLVEELHVERDESGGEFAPDYNVAPTHSSPVVLERPLRNQQRAVPVRQLRLLTWGLVPSWAKDPSVGSRMINARVETLLDKPAFRRAAVARRCLIPVDGWYEWQVSPTSRDAKGKPRKQPFFAHLADGSQLVLAGLYEFWRDQASADDDPQAWRTTFTIITTAAEAGLDRLHDRMPFAVPPDRWDSWLDSTLIDPEQIRDLLRPVAPGRFAAYPVSRRVGNVRNTGPDLLLPASLDELDGVLDPMTGEVIGPH